MGSAAARRRTGQRAEQIACDHYLSRGFTLEGRNVRLGRLEIDLLARRGPLLVVVEVRARRPGSVQGPFASVVGAKLRRLRQAAERIWRQRQHDRTLERVRVDVAAVDLWVTPVEVSVAEAVV